MNPETIGLNELIYEKPELDEVEKAIKAHKNILDFIELVHKNYREETELFYDFDDLWKQERKIASFIINKLQEESSLNQPNNSKSYSASYGKAIIVTYLNYIDFLNSDIRTSNDINTVKKRVLSLDPGVPIIYDINKKPKLTILQNDPLMTLSLQDSSSSVLEYDTGISSKFELNCGIDPNSEILIYSVSDLLNIRVGSEDINSYLPQLKFKQEGIDDIERLAKEYKNLKQNYTFSTNPNDPVMGEINFSNLTGWSSGSF